MTSEAETGPGPDRLTITLNGEKVELFMSFGLLNELTAMVGNAALVGLVATDPQLSQGVLMAVLAKRDNRGKIIEEPNLYSLSGDDVKELHKVFQWVMGHTLDFFLKSLGNAAEIGRRFQKDMTDLFPPSLNGSEPSPSETPAVGPQA